MNFENRSGSCRRRSAARIRVSLALSVSALVGAPLLGAGLAQADPSPTPEPSVSATPSTPPPATPSATPSTTTPSAAPSEQPQDTPVETGSAASPTAHAPTPTPSSASSPTPTAGPTLAAPPRPAARAASAPLTLAVSSTGSPVAGRFYEDIGSFVFTGVRGDHAAGRTIEIWRYGPSIKKWYLVSSVKSGSGGSYRASQPVNWVSSDVRFCATLGGSPSTTSVTKMCAASVVVRDATISMTKPVSSVDAVQDPTISGSVSPARAGVKINVDVKRSDHVYRPALSTTTDKYGRYSVKLTYGTGSLAKYWVRTSYQAANRNRLEKDPSQSVTRIAVLNAKVAKTTAADVAKTYRAGCPVGPSKLRTISMNFYGADHKMHRGVIIIRTDLADDLIRAFGSALTHRFPIDKMNNPNVYGGIDTKQMEAGNTSGFNCRKVTGNPYAQSPHSYGTALDVNTKENPYRDVQGRWYPTSGKSYIKRSPARSGMLFASSALTKSLVKDHFFWGANWYPGRDYQHFQR